MKFETRTAELSSGPVTYHVAGDGPKVVHMHPAGGFRQSAALEALAASFRIYAPVTPGFDGTPTHDSVTSMQALAKLDDEFSHEVVGERADIIGHSFGGWRSAWYTVLYPQNVGQLVLECPAGFREGGVGGLSSDPEEMRRRLYARPDRIPPETKPAEMLANNRKMLAHYHGGIPIDRDLVARLGEIEALTLILHGTKDTAIPESSARLLKAHIPRAFLIYVYDAAHALETDQPDHFVNLVGDFLTRGEAFLVNPGSREEAA